MEARHGQGLNLEAVADGGRRHFPQPSVRVVAGVVYRLAAHSLGVVAAGVGPGPDRRTGAGPRG